MRSSSDTSINPARAKTLPDRSVWLPVFEFFSLFPLNFIAEGVNLGAQCTTVCKLCSSAIKSVAYTSMSIARGNAGVAIAGGYESMSNVPFLIPNVFFGFFSLYKLILIILVETRCSIWQLPGH